MTVRQSGNLTAQRQTSTTSIKYWIMINHLQGLVLLLAPHREQTAEVYYFLLREERRRGAVGENENSKANERSTGLLKKKTGCSKTWGPGINIQISIQIICLNFWSAVPFKELNPEISRCYAKKLCFFVGERSYTSQTNMSPGVGGAGMDVWLLPWGPAGS